MYKKRDFIAYPPRGLNRDDAVRYIGLGAGTFDSMVNDGRMPRPKIIDDRLIWDREHLDAAFTALVSDDSPAASRRMPIDRTTKAVEVSPNGRGSTSTGGKPGDTSEAAPTPVPTFGFGPDVETLLRLKEVIAITGLASSTIYRRMSESRFPRPYDLGGNTVRWKRTEVQRWLDALSANGALD